MTRFKDKSYTSRPTESRKSFLLADAFPGLLVSLPPRAKPEDETILIKVYSAQSERLKGLSQPTTSSEARGLTS